MIKVDVKLKKEKYLGIEGVLGIPFFRHTWWRFGLQARTKCSAVFKEISLTHVTTVRFDRYGFTPSNSLAPTAEQQLR
jgi:hypothetical protein